MIDERFLTEYENLLDKGYCNCNEMNCIDNNSPRRILNIAKRLQQEKQIECLTLEKTLLQQVINESEEFKKYKEEFLKKYKELKVKNERI